jgi:hypothetical protein
VTTFLNDHWQVVGVIMAVVVGGAVAYVMTRPNPPADLAEAGESPVETADVSDPATGVQS